MKTAGGELPTGIKKTYRGDDWRGYRVTVWVPWWPGYPDGRVLTKRFNRDATIPAMMQWREDQGVLARRLKNEKAPDLVVDLAAGFRTDALRYLQAKFPPFDERGRPRDDNRRYTDCCRYVEIWVSLFGDRDHRTITASEIRAQCNAWIARGPKSVQTKKGRVLKPLPLSPQEVNLRLRKLENMWTELWPDEDNLVRQIDEYGDAVEAKPRGQTFERCYEVLRYMPDFTSAKKGELPEAGSLSRARFEVMFLTGLEQQQIARLLETDLDWTRPAIKYPLRQKGRSQKRRKRPRRILRERPLITSAVPALRRLFALGGNKPYSSASIGRAIRAGVTAANLDRTTRHQPLLPTDLRPKDWTRHTFGTEMWRQTHDVKIVAEYLGHADTRMAEIYAEAALQEDMIEAAAKMSALAAKAQGQPAPTEDGQTYASWRRQQHQQRTGRGR